MEIKRNVVSRFLLLWVVGMLLSVQVFAQGLTVKGVVKDNTGMGVIGANILVKGTTNGTITDFDGNFELNVPDGVVDIEARYVSYKSRLLRHIKVEGEIISNIELEEAAQALGAVEVVARRNRESENMLLLEQKTAVFSESDGNVKVENPDEAKFSFAGELSGSVTINGVVFTASDISAMLGASGN